MIQDKDLTFLATCNNEDLRTLCDILTYNEKGEVRMSEQLTNSDAYIKHYPEQMKLMAKEIGEELRKYGSNTVKTFCRKGEADSYETIVRRVCKRMHVKVSDSESTAAMERELLTTICEQTTNKLSDEELRALADKAGIPHKNLNHQMLVTAVMFAIRRNAWLFTEMIYYGHEHCWPLSEYCCRANRLGGFGRMDHQRYCLTSLSRHDTCCHHGCFHAFSSNGFNHPKVITS